MAKPKGTFNIEVLPDGKIKVTSPDAFDPTIHAQADELFELLKEMTGGVIVEHKDLSKGKHHHHGHGEHHTHGENAH